MGVLHALPDSLSAIAEALISTIPDEIVSTCGCGFVEVAGTSTQFSPNEFVWGTVIVLAVAFALLGRVR